MSTVFISYAVNFALEGNITKLKLLFVLEYLEVTSARTLKFIKSNSRKCRVSWHDNHEVFISSYRIFVDLILEQGSKHIYSNAEGKARGDTFTKIARLKIIANIYINTSILPLYHVHFSTTLIRAWNLWFVYLRKNKLIIFKTVKIGG